MSPFLSFYYIVVVLFCRVDSFSICFFISSFLSTVGSGPSLAMRALCGLALATWLLAFVLTCASGSFVCAGFTGYLVFVLMGVGHNFFHQRDSLWRFCFDVSCFSSSDWRISHALSHHMYPNMDLDLEATGTEPFVRHLRSQPTNSSWVYAYWHLFNFVVPLTQFADHRGNSAFLIESRNEDHQ